MKQVFAIFFGVFLLQGEALATQDSLGYRATCAPELNLMRIETMILANPDYVQNADLAQQRYGIFGIGEEFECALGDNLFLFRWIIEETSDGSAKQMFVALERDGNIVFKFPYLADVNGSEEIVSHVFDVNRYAATYCVYDGKEKSSCSKKWLKQLSAPATQTKN